MRSSLSLVSRRTGMADQSRLDRTLTIYVCPAKACPAFFGIDSDTEDGSGDHGWNPDGWPHCSEHKRPMRPVRVEEVRSVPHEHPAGCFYGSFADAYPDAWHIPHGVECRLDHGTSPIHLNAPSGFGRVLGDEGGDRTP